MLNINVIFVHQHSPFLKIKKLKTSLALHGIEMKRIIGFCSRNSNLYQKTFSIIDLIIQCT